MTMFLSCRRARLRTGCRRGARRACRTVFCSLRSSSHPTPVPAAPADLQDRAARCRAAWFHHTSRLLLLLTAPLPLPACLFFFLDLRARSGVHVFGWVVISPFVRWLLPVFHRSTRFPVLLLPFRCTDSTRTIYHDSSCCLPAAFAARVLLPSARVTSFAPRTFGWIAAPARSACPHFPWYVTRCLLPAPCRIQFAFRYRFGCSTTTRDFPAYLPAA